MPFKRERSNKEARSWARPSGELLVRLKVPEFIKTKLLHGVPPHTKAPDRAAHQLWVCH